MLVKKVEEVKRTPIFRRAQSTWDASSGANNFMEDLISENSKPEREYSEGTPLYKYELGDVLGEGSFGKVYQATHKETGRLYAIKQNFVNGQQDLRDLFMEEGRLMHSLADKTSIVKCYEYFEAEADVWIVQELCEGGNLLQNFILSN